MAATSVAGVTATVLHRTARLKQTLRTIANTESSALVEELFPSIDEPGPKAFMPRETVKEPFGLKLRGKCSVEMPHDSTLNHVSRWAEIHVQDGPLLNNLQEQEFHRRTVRMWTGDEYTDDGQGIRGYSPHVFWSDIAGGE